MNTPIKSPDIDLARVRIEAICHDCKHRHLIEVNPNMFGRAAFDWEVKHRHHNIEFLSTARFLPRGFDDRVYNNAGLAPWWVDYKHNADLKVAYAADAALAITLASLPTSSDWTTGRESDSVSNSSNKYVDYDFGGKITTGTSPSANAEIRAHLIRPIEDTPTWPDVFDGTDSAETVTNTQILANIPILWSTLVAATSNIGYPIINAQTIAMILGLVPDNWTLFVSHNTGVNLNSTGGNHAINYRGIYFTSA